MAHVNEGSHSFTCHPHVYPRMEWTIPAFTPQWQSITALWLVLISRPAEGRRLSWPGEILRWFVHQRRPPIPVLTGPDVEQLRWYAQRRYQYATLPQVIPSYLKHVSNYYVTYTASFWLSGQLPSLLVQSCTFTVLPNCQQKAAAVIIKIKSGLAGL